jgi:hypothetical protein
MSGLVCPILTFKLISIGRQPVLIAASRCSWGSETRTSCGDLVVLVNETAESVPAPNTGGDCDRIRPSPNLDTSGRPKREASVRPLTVVVPQVLVEHPLKMTPTPDRHPIQTLLPHRPHPALGERVGVRRLNRGLDDLDAVSGEDVVEGADELGIPVTLEEPRGGRALRPSISIESSRARWTTKLGSDGR